MQEKNYIIRKDYKSKYIINHEKYIDAQKILEIKYDYILKSMENESYKINNKLCNYFQEILYEDKVVGFSTYIIFNEIKMAGLTYIYVLPEYRGNRYFIKEIQNIIANEYKFAIVNPSHRLIEILLENEWAEKLDNLVISSIHLIISKDSIISTDKNNKIDTEFIGSNIYDLKASATIILDIEEDDLPLYYTALQEVDVKEYDANRQRKKISKKYFKILKDEMIQNLNEIMELQCELKERLPHIEYQLKDIVGEYPELSDELKKHIDNGVITVDRANEIQGQITEEFMNGLVLSDGLKVRLDYLVNDDSKDEFYENDILTCFYCNNIIDITDSFCDRCGLNLRIQRDMENNLQELDNAIMEFASELKKKGFRDDEIDEIISEELNELSDEITQNVDK